MLFKIAKYQRRALKKAADKTVVKKRFVCGMKEVLKKVKAKRIKLVVLTPNIENVTLPNGLNQLQIEIATLCRDNNILFFVALTKMTLGKALMKPVGVSVVGILDFSGAHELYLEALKLAEKVREEKKVQDTTLMIENKKVDLLLKEKMAEAEILKKEDKKEEELVEEENVEENGENNNQMEKEEKKEKSEIEKDEKEMQGIKEEK